MAQEFQLLDEDFRFLAERAKALAGIELPPHKRELVYSRLTRRLRQLNLNCFSDYCKLLTGEESKQENGHFINALTTNLTSFFREKHHFDHLYEALREWLTASASPRLRIWSAGCSRGMEPYSIALTCREALQQRPVDLKVLATDIDTKVLNHAVAGIYTADEIQAVTPDQCSRYFHEVDDGYEVDDSLKSLIIFKQLNLMQPWPMQGRFDAIFCRNVLIYFSKETQYELFARFAGLLKPGGFLYIGHSETMRGHEHLFASCGRTIYQKHGKDAA
jgi:chemotaxis protein methyltransferase CheR